MREHRYCDGCGAGGFHLAETFAVTASDGELEVAVWRCGGCGGLAEEEVPAPPVDVQTVVRARVA